MAKVRNGTLVANTASGNLDVVEGPKGINVINRSAMEGKTRTPIWVSLTSTPPTVAGADCYPVYGARLFLGDEITNEIRLISTEALDYTVEAA